MRVREPAASAVPPVPASIASGADAAVQHPPEQPVTPAPDLPETLEQPPIRHAFQEPLPGPERLASSPARRYANLSAAQCRAELQRRKLPAKPAGGPASGVANPVRLAGPLSEVRFIAPGSRSVYGMLDCRLVLALEELAALLREQGVTAVHVDNFYRPRARLPGRKSKRSQHAYGLAIDMMGLTFSDGRTLTVERDWDARPGAAACGDESSAADLGPNAITLRNVVCAIARAGLFHHILTPNYDAAHADHFHLDIKRDARALVVR